LGDDHAHLRHHITSICIEFSRHSTRWRKIDYCILQSQTANFDHAAPGESIRVYALWGRLMSKHDVIHKIGSIHNILQRHHRKTELRPQKSCNKYLAMEVREFLKLFSLSVRHTDTPITILRTRAVQRCSGRRAFVLPLFVIYLFILTFSVRPIISASTGPIFTTFAGLV